MARMQFTSGTRYHMDQQMYLVLHPLEGGRLLVDNLTMGRQERPTQEELYAAWTQNALRFAVPTHLASKDAAEQNATHYSIADFQGLPGRYRDEAWRRYTLLLPLLRMAHWERSRETITAYAARLQAQYPGRSDHKRSQIGRAAARTSLERWLHLFEQSGYDIRALVPGCSQRADQGRSHLDPEIERCIQACIEECKLKPAHRTLKSVHLMVANRIADLNRFRSPDQQLTPPARSTLYERIQSVGPESILRRKAGRLETHAQQPYLPGPEPTRILERVEIDMTTLDLIVVDDQDCFPIGRPNLTFALDCYSGFPLGLDVGFERQSYRSVMNCLLHGILPKVDTSALYGTKHLWLAFGLPETLIVDNGKAFIGNDLKDACGQLGIHLEQMPIKTPWFKGAIERFFRTNNTGLIHGLPGTTFSNIVARGDYNAIEHACISLSDFLRLVHVFLLDYYAQDIHTKLGIVPAHRWNESVQAGFAPCVPSSAEELRIILYSTEWRTVGRGGIDFESLRYQSPELTRLRTSKRVDSRPDDDLGAMDSGRAGAWKKVQIKYNPGNLHEIYVLDPAQQKWLPVPAVDPIGYTDGLSIWKHRAIKRYALEKIPAPDIYDLAEARHHIQEIVDKAFERTQRVRKQAKVTRSSKIATRTKAARYKDIGTGGLPTPATATTSTTQVDQAPGLDSDLAHANADKIVMETEVGATLAPSGIQSKTTTARRRRPESAGNSSASVSPKGSHGRAPVKSPPSGASQLPSVLPAIDLSEWGADYDLPTRK